MGQAKLARWNDYGVSDPEASLSGMFMKTPFIDIRSATFARTLRGITGGEINHTAVEESTGQVAARGNHGVKTKRRGWSTTDHQNVTISLI